MHVFTYSQNFCSVTNPSFMFEWRGGVVVVTTAQFHLTKPELSFCASSIPACGVSEIRDGEDL